MIASFFVDSNKFFLLNTIQQLTILRLNRTAPRQCGGESQIAIGRDRKRFTGWCAFPASRTARVFLGEQHESEHLRRS